MSTEGKSYKDLEVWKKSRELVTHIYKLSASFPDEEKFGLTIQIRRSAVSVVSNIAEGIGRNSEKETLQFLYIAKGSLYETETQLYVAHDLEFCSAKILDAILAEITTVRKLLIGFIKYKNQSTHA